MSKTTVLTTQRSLLTSTTGRGCCTVIGVEWFSRKFPRVHISRRNILFFSGPLPYTNPLLLSQGKYAEAEPLYERSQAIREKALGPEHPAVATVLNNRASLLESQVRAVISFQV